MKKSMATIAAGVLLCLSSAANAERSSGSRHSSRHNILVGVDSEFAIPLGNYADVNSVGMGAVLVGELPMLETVSATARVGFQGHFNRTVGNGLGAHVNAIPVLLGAKYYIGGDRQGLFGAFELGMFDLMSSVEQRVGGNVTTNTSNDVKFGMGLGLGISQDRWNARVNLHTQDVGNFGSAFVISGGIGYQFASL
jgi:hypothetical protein